jgi:RNA polymerase sigma factor (sigma-70 family)
MRTKQAAGSVPGGEVVTARPQPSFDDFYRAEMPGLVALARALCGSVAAEDVAQEAMVAACRRWKHVADLQYPAGWVRRVCANLAVSQYRRRLIELRALTRLAGRREEYALSASDDEFWRAVRQLPARQAQATALRYVYDLEVAEIARTLDISDGAVKQHLSRARARLAQDLRLDDVEEADRRVSRLAAVGPPRDCAAPMRSTSRRVWRACAGRLGVETSRVLPRLPSSSSA